MSSEKTEINETIETTEAAEATVATEDNKSRKQRSDPTELLGKRFTRLLVEDLDGRDNRGRQYYRCKCDCGNVSRVRKDHLMSGAVKSCGCLRSENVKIASQAFVDGTYLPKVKAALEGTPTSKSSTGVRGVYERNGKFTAALTFRGRRVWLGTYKTLEEATVARSKGVQEFFGAWAEEKGLKQ